MTVRPTRHSRLFRALVRLLPFDFRFDYGGEMEQVFREQRLDAARERGRVGVFGLWLGLARDIAITAPREHASDIGRDVRYALRGLRRSPGFAAVAVLTLAIGIGVNTAIFSVVDQVLLRPTGVSGFEHVAMIWETDRHSGTVREPASVPDYLDFQSRTRRLSSLAAFIPVDVNLSLPGGEPVRLAGLAVSHTFLPMLAVKPLAGRGFNEEDDRANGPKVALISEALWTRSFARDPGVVGRTVLLDEVPHLVVGVVPARADFGVLQVLAAAAYARSFVDRGAAVSVDVWRPLQADPAASSRDTHPVFQVGRVKDGPALAQQELSQVAADLERTYPRSNTDRGVFVEPLDEVVFGPVRPALYTLLGAVGLVLLVACVNIASLLLARGAARLREVGVRAALGASRWRVARQFLIENLVLALVAAVAGVLMAFAGLRVLVAMAPADIPRVAAVTLDVRVLGATLAISLIVGIVFGMVPTLQAWRLDVQGALKGVGDARASSGRAHVRARGALVVAEVALAVVLLVAGGLLLRSYLRLQGVDPGFRAGGLLKAEYQLPASRYPVDFKKWPDFHEMHAFTQGVLRRTRGLPGVESAAVAGEHPLDPGFTNSFVVVGREAEAKTWPEIAVRRVSAGYFGTVGLALVRGRLLEERDGTRAAPVLLVNETAARRFFPGRDPVGSQIRFWGAARTVVGVVANEKFRGLSAAAPLAVYVPLAQAPSVTGAGVLLVRSTGDPTALSAAVRRAIHDQDPGLAVFGVESLSQTLSRSVSRPRFTVVLLGLFAVLGILLAAIGIHGVLAYGVAQRRREFGVRMALGASADSVRAMVIRQGLSLTLMGLAVGIPTAVGVSRVLRSLLFDTGPADPLTYGVVSITFIAVAVIASYAPARRATRVDPILALRAE